MFPMQPGFDPGFDPFGMMGGGTPGANLQGGLPSLLSGGNTPQQQGYGISDPTQPMPWNTGPGLMPGAPIPGMEGLDLGVKGAAESAYDRMAGRFEAPGQASQFWGQAQDAFKGPGMGETFAGNALSKYAAGTPGVTQNSATEYGRSVSGQPQLSANLDPYYENAKRRSAEEINQQMAARGMAGGTPGMDRVAEAFTDLNAQQAKDEASYGLQRSADMRGWQALQGSLAGQADQGSAMASQNERDWLRGLGDMAFTGQNAGLDRMRTAGALAGQADQADLSRMLGGMSAAGDAQRFQMGRANNLWDMQMGQQGMLSALANNTYDQMFAGDQALMDGGMGMELGLGAEALNQDYRGQQRFKNDFDWAYEKVPILGALGGGGGGGLGGLF